MSFDMKGFMKAKFQDRTEDVPVPDLKSWFPEDSPAVITVRGLTGAELARVNEAAARNKNLEGIIEALSSANASDKIEGIKESLGFTGKVPDDLAKRIEQLTAGAVEPEFTLEQAVRFFEVYPVEAWQVTNKIMELTGKGKLPGESKPSGKTTESGQAA